MRDWENRCPKFYSCPKLGEVWGKTEDEKLELQMREQIEKICRICPERPGQNDRA